jgi:prophage antirepressor-like protein
MQRYEKNGNLTKGLQNFQFEGKEVRVVVEQNNVLLFVAVDVCNILGYTNLSQTLKRLGDGVISNYPIADKKGRNQPTNMLTEQGLDSLISGSRKAEASRFDEWVKETFYQKELKFVTQSIDFQAFVFGNGLLIRAWLDEYGNPWFAGIDVCNALGYANSRDALSHHCEKRWGSKTLRHRLVGQATRAYHHQRTKLI